MTKYYSLLVRDDANSPWQIAFGDYDRDVCVEEYEDSYSEYSYKIIRTDDDQASINARVNELNRHEECDDLPAPDASSAAGILHSMQTSEVLEDRREYTVNDLKSMYGIDTAVACELYALVQAEFTANAIVSVEGLFGKNVNLTRDKFINRWAAHASELVFVDINIGPLVDEVRKKAGAQWDELFAKQNGAL